MTSLALDRPQAAASTVTTEQLHWLMDAVRRNRFIPAPEPENIFVGDGDFRAIGAEFLGHLVRFGKLQPHHRVLDVGCGIGRLAAPLTQYLDDGASYLGLDPARDGIAWCQKAITPVYPSFRFRHIDVAHTLYNPQGLLRGASLVLPLGDRSVDFALLVSVVTHLPPDEVITYSRELSRVLTPGGTVFMTCFTIPSDGVPKTVTDPRCNFLRIDDGPSWTGRQDDPLGMIAYDEGWLEARLAEAGFECEPCRRGSWRGTEAAHYQDIIVARRRSGRA